MQESYWIKKHETTHSYPKLTKEIHTQIAIIGAGLTGLLTGYFLSNTDKEVVILEADQVCYGASGRSTGKLSSQHGLIYHNLINRYDLQFAKQYYTANDEALKTIVDIIETHQISCDFERCDSMLFTKDKQHIAKLQEEYQAYLDLDIPCEYIDQTDTPFPIEAGLIIKQQAHFDPYAFGCAIAEIIEKKGIQLYEHSPVTEMIKEHEKYKLIVHDQYVYADDVIFASQFPFIDKGHFFFTKMYSQQETILTTTNQEHPLSTMMLSIDTDVQSFNQHQNVLLYAGNVHKSGQTKMKTHEEFAYTLPSIYATNQIQDAWTSQDYITFDQLPMIGKLDKDNDHVLFASGFNKWGNTTSCVAAKLLCSYILQKPSMYQMLYSPQRLSNIFSLAFVKENMNVVMEFIKSKLQSSSSEYPQSNEGSIIEIDGHRYGVYRDEYDEYYIVDILCPHMGCTLHFNEEEKTWDCPCHGSRFSYKGDIIKGPATQKLHTIDEDHNSINPHLR